MASPVTFVYADWIARYPEFVLVPEATVTAQIPVAEMFWRNDGTSPATTDAIQATIFYAVIAHLVQLYWGTGAAPSPAGIVGRISNASEGSVSVAAEWPTNPSNAWWLQTQYGASFWAMTAQYRTMRYIPGYQRIFNPWLGPGRWLR